MSKQLRLDVAQLTDVGRKRPHNEDNMAHVIPKDAQLMTKKGALFIVADGMGGHAAGEVASEIAVDTVSTVYYLDDSEDIAVSLLHAIKRANALIHQRAAENMMRSGMGTTCVAAVMRANVAYIANVGDSRVYLIRHGQVRQVSQDHSWVEEQVRAGLLTKDQARLHAQRNVITRSLGTQLDVDVDMFCEQLEEGDTFILCSDGLSGMVPDEELHAIVDQYAPQDGVYRLIERANENGGTDNITAIVIRVQEIGWEPPTARRPVRVGGREASEADTAIIGRIQAPMYGMPARSEDGRIPSSPLQVTSGPFTFSENTTTTQAPHQPAESNTQAQAQSRKRLMYSIVTLILVVLLIAAGGGYYMWRYQNQQTDVNARFADASVQIEQAKRNISANPTDALAQLAKAQQALSGLQPNSLNDSLRSQLTVLQTSLIQTTRLTISNYNQQALITALPCSNTSSNPLNTGNISVATPTTTGDGASATNNTIASLQDEKGNTVFYILGDDHNVYQVDANHNLANKANLPGTQPQALMVASNSQRLAILYIQPGSGSTPTAYHLSLLKASASGALQNLNDILIDASFTKDGQAPALITASPTDIYLVLVSSSQPNAATILDFPINSDKLDTPHKTPLSITTAIVSITAFGKNQLFLLFRDGNIQSLPLGTASPIAASVSMTRSIPTPLTVNPNDFSITVPVPQPGSDPSAQSQFLSAPGATFLTTGMDDNEQHLYIVDSIYHRIIDLKMTQSAPPATPAVGATPTETKTPATGTPTAVPLTMELVQQYTGSNTFSSVKGISSDPKNAVLYLLTQNGQNLAAVNLVTVDVSQKAQCAAS